MGGWFDDWREDMKKTWLFKSAKSVGRTSAKIGAYGAPIFGGLFLGPLGALGGTFLGAGLAQVGPTKNREAQLKRSLIYGGAVTAGTAALGVVSGAGLGSSIFKSAAAIFGGGATPVAAAPPSETTLVTMDPTKVGSPGTGNTLDPTSAALQTALASAGVKTQANPADLLKQYQDQLTLAQQRRAAGDIQGALEAEALAAMYRQQLEAAGIDPNSAGGGINPWWLVAGGVGLYFLARKAA